MWLRLRHYLHLLSTGHDVLTYRPLGVVLDVFCRCHTVYVIHHGVSFRRPARLSATHVFVPCDALSPYLALQARRHTFVIVHSITGPSALSSLTGLSRISPLIIHFLGGLLLLCAATGSFRSVRIHTYTCLPARGRDSGESLLACSLAFGLRQAAYVSARRVQVITISAFPGSLLGVFTFHGVG